MTRSLLFLPGNSPKMLLNGEWLPCDGLIFDLEDAVAPDQKDAARILVRQALSTVDYGNHTILVRINALDTPYWRDDLRQVLPAKPDMILLPKADCAETILTLAEEMNRMEETLACSGPPVRIAALIETAIGVENAFAIASSSERVSALFLGAEDLTADLQSVRTKAGEEIAYARGRLVNAARASQIDVYDTPFTDVEDLAGLRADAEFARALGFTGKLVISPRHIDEVNRVFAPSLSEIQYAREVLQVLADGKRQGRGAVSLHGKMIDAPVVKRAEHILQMVEQLEMG